MKRWLLALCVICILPGAAGGQLPPRGYIGLYADDYHSSWCVNGVGFYPFTYWAWCLPGEYGMICAEFAVDFPANVIRSTVSYHPDFPIVIDPSSPEIGLSLCYSSCKWDWVWVYHQTCYVMDALPSHLEIIRHTWLEEGDIQFANCEPGFPIEPVTTYTNLYINHDPAGPECSGTAVENRSWGAIKSLVGRR